jgi:hypothetical protein
MSNKQKFEQLVESSQLPEIDKAEWQMIINESPENLVDAFYEALEKYPQELVWFNDIYKRKKVALAMLNANNREARVLLDEIYEEEKNKLEQLITK